MPQAWPSADPTTLFRTPPVSANSVTPAPVIFTVLEEELGLRLEGTTAPTDVFVVE